MSEFIKQEKTIKQENSKNVLRFLWNLTHLRRAFAPSLLVILICAALPQYFLWFMGHYVHSLETGSLDTHVTHTLFSHEFTIPLEMKTLWLIILLTLTARIISWGLFELTGNWSLQLIHKKMMASLSKTRTTFFDENPSGRMINRIVGNYFSLDWCVIQVGDCLNSLAEILCVAVLIYIANPLPAFMVIPLVFCYFLFQFQWTPMLSHSKELSTIAFGEVMHRETDLIEGRDVFSLYNKGQNLMARLHKAYLKSFNIGLFSAKIQWWGELWMALITISFNLVVYTFLVLGINHKALSPVFAAIIITALLNLSDLFGFFTWSVTHLGESAANVRRIFEFIDLPDEAVEERVQPLEPSYEKPNFPTSGDIIFDRFTMSYRKESKTILKNLSLTIPKEKRVGIVGRTGAGKSSFFQSLFRMVYLKSGDIKIGDTSIYSMDINVLRSLFGVVPQDPYLFSGTIRFNLSGGNSKLSDEKMIQALKKVGLQISLDDTIQEGGRDLSLGERQLICLARVLAADKQYILMDEPTSSVDMITDARIQKILTTHLSGKTIITIAHRLDSLGQYDLIIELKNGKFLRQGRPEQIIPDILREDQPGSS